MSNITAPDHYKTSDDIEVIDVIAALEHKEGVLESLKARIRKYKEW